MTKPDGSKVRAPPSLKRVVARVSARFNYVLFPLDLPTFAAALAARDFLTAGELPQEPLGIPPGGYVGGQGVVGRKGDLRADINTDKQFFGVAGMQDPALLLEEVRGILEALKETIDLARVEFFELQARYRVSQPGSPHARISRLGERSRIVEHASKTFAQPMELYGAQLVSERGDPNSPDYFEVWFQPVPSLVNVMGVVVTMRNPNVKEFGNLTIKLEDNISDFLSAPSSN